MFTLGFFVNMIFIALIYHIVVEINIIVNMVNKKNQKKVACEKYNKYLHDYDMEKKKYESICGSENNYNISSEINKILHDYKEECRTVYYCDNYSYKGVWENNTQNGFGIDMKNEQALISGNRKQNKYHGLMKVHIEDVPGGLVANYHCLYNEGKREKCYFKYKHNKLYEITDAKLQLFDFIQM